MQRVLISVGAKGLKGLKLSDLGILGSCLSNKYGMPPILYVKVPTNYETKTPLPEFYEKEEID